MIDEEEETVNIDGERETEIKRCFSLTLISPGYSIHTLPYIIHVSNILVCKLVFVQAISLLYENVIVTYSQPLSDTVTYQLWFYD